MGAAVISGVNATPVLEFSEHVFDFVALSVQRRIMRNRDLSVACLEGRSQGLLGCDVRANWRVIFRFADRRASDVDLIDYH